MRRQSEPGPWLAQPRVVAAAIPGPVPARAAPAPRPGLPAAALPDPWAEAPPEA